MCVLFDHLSICITVMISAVRVRSIAFFVLFFFIDNRWLLNYFPMKSAGVCQPLIKFGMFTFIVLHAIPFIMFFP